MANNIKGITIEFNGDVTKLQKALSTVNKASKATYDELKNIDRGLKFNPTNVELLGQKHQKLQERIQTTSEKLKVLKEADKQAKAQLEKGELGQDEYNNLRREIIETESKLKSFKAELKGMGSVNVAAISAQLEKVGTKLQQVGGKITSVGKSLTTKLTLPLAGVGAVAFKSAAELEDAMGATDQIFGNASNSMKEWANGIESYYGIAEGEALTYSNTMGAMLQNIGGLSEQEAAKQAQILTELAGDLSAMFGGSTQDAINALTGALKGNNTMLDNYGMGVNDATIKAKAFEMGLYSGKGAMDLQTKQAATLALIMEQTAAAQGQAAREAQGASGSMKALQTTISNLATDIGQALLPIITPLVQKFTEWVNRFKELDPGIQSLIVKIGLLIAVIGPALVIIGSIVGAIGTIVSAIGGMIIAMTGAETAMAGFKIALTAIKTSLSGLFAFVSANPIVLIIGAMVAAVALLIANWDWVKEKASQLWSSLTQTFNNIKTTISDVWNSISGTAVEKWNGIKDAITGPIEKAKELVGKAIDAIKGFFNFKFRWPKIPMPHFGIRPSGWKIGDLLKGSIPKLGINWYAQGGIFDNPSLIGVGEAGSEAVVPTHKLDKFLEDGVNRVLNRVNGNQGQGIIINVNEMNVRDDNDIKLLAEEVLRRIDLKTSRKANVGGLA